MQQHDSKVLSRPVTRLNMSNGRNEHINQKDPTSGEYHYFFGDWIDGPRIDGPSVVDLMNLAGYSSRRNPGFRERVDLNTLKDFVVRPLIPQERCTRILVCLVVADAS